MKVCWITEAGLYSTHWNRDLRLHIALSESLSVELKTFNIRVLLVETRRLPNPVSCQRQHADHSNVNCLQRNCGREDRAGFQRYGWEAGERPGERRSKDLRSRDGDWHGKEKTGYLKCMIGRDCRGRAMKQVDSVRRLRGVPSLRNSDRFEMYGHASKHAG